MSSTSGSVLLALLLAGCGGAAVAPEAPRAVQQADVVLPAPAPPMAEAPVADAKEGDAAEDGVGEGDSGDDAPPDEVDDLTDSPMVMGSVLGGEVPESYGVGGLGLSGVGLGAGGTGSGTIGLGGIGTLGHGSGTGTGQGFGSGSGRLGGTHRPLPRVSTADPSIGSGYPREIIQRIVRSNINRFRYCYEKGLQKDPTLAGRVTLSFVIGTDGSVTSVKATSSLTDTEVQTCVAAAFKTLSFPKPDSGIVQVTYPLLFTPGATPGSTTPAASATLAGKALEDAQTADLEKALQGAGCTDVGTKAGATTGTWVVSAKRGGRVFTVTLVSKQAAPLSDADLAKLQTSSAVKASGGAVLSVSSDSMDASTLLLAELLR